MRLYFAIMIFFVVRYVIFCILWSLTFGKLKFWLLPNLTADCGFRESFIPVYKYEFANAQSDGKCTTTDGRNAEGEEGGMLLHDAENTDEVEKKSDAMDSDEKQKDNGSEHNSGRNNDIDDWVKVSKHDASENSIDHEVKC